MVLNILYIAESGIWHIQIWESHYIFQQIFSNDIIFYQCHEQVTITLVFSSKTKIVLE